MLGPVPPFQRQMQMLATLGVRPQALEEFAKLKGHGDPGALYRAAMHAAIYNGSAEFWRGALAQGLSFERVRRGLVDSLREAGLSPSLWLVEEVGGLPWGLARLYVEQMAPDEPDEDEWGGEGVAR